MSAASRTAFFYGTLILPEILKRVLDDDDIGHRLEVARALLPGYTRHKIKGVSYPAIIPYWKSREAFNQELDITDQSVWGTLVAGLTDEDFEMLDDFEDTEYIRTVVDVERLEPFRPIGELAAERLSSQLAPLSGLESVVHQAEVYVFGRSDVSDFLEEELWDFEKFVREDAVRWL